MAAKKVPWWRRALKYALGGVRSGFGLFSRPAQTETAPPLKENSLIDKPEESLEVETVLTKQPNPEILPAAVEAVAAPTSAAKAAPVAGDAPPAEPTVAAAIEPKPALEIASPPEPEAGPGPQHEPNTKPIAETLTKVEPLPAAEAVPEPELIPAAEPLSKKPAAAPESAPISAATSPVASAAETPAAAAIEPNSAPETPTVPTPKPFIKLETRDDEANLSPFSVVVEQVYDGPLDLLLDLIRKQDIDIYDIPIAIITAQFLAYVNQLKASDVDVAGDFIYIASLLIHIKSKMLLPRSPAGPEEAAEDPRRELVERLLEHERFKNAAQMLQQKQMLEAATWTNPGFREFQGDVAAEPEIAADTVDLVRVFRDVLERVRSRPVFDVDEDAVTVGQMIQFLARRLTMEDKPVALRRLLSHTRSERALIAIFLALLELVRLQAVLLRQDRQFSEIFVKKHTGFDAVMNEGLANARDDWK
jgi:segregation and condensation protein A